VHDPVWLNSFFGIKYALLYTKELRLFLQTLQFIYFTHGTVFKLFFFFSSGTSLISLPPLTKTSKPRKKLLEKTKEKHL